MLGQQLDDVTGVDGHAGTRQGLGLLDMSTTMHAEKYNSPVQATCLASDSHLDAYEIHVGESQGPDCQRPLFRLSDGRVDGACSVNGQVTGTYLHGLFSNADYRRHWLRQLNATFDPGYSAGAAVHHALDDLADGVEAAVDIEQLFELAAPLKVPASR